MRVSAINNNQNQQNFGFKVKSVHLKSANRPDPLKLSEEGKKLLFPADKIDLFVTDTLTIVRDFIQTGIQNLKHNTTNNLVGRFLFKGTPEKPILEDLRPPSKQFAIQKDGENYTLIAYIKHVLDSGARKGLNIEEWGVDSKESKNLTVTKIVEIEPENTKDLEDLRKMHAQMAENITPFKDHYKKVTGKELPENYMIDSKAL